MASTNKKNTTRCRLCHKSVEHYCNLCHVNLCSTCIPKHVANKTNRHEVVEFIHRKEGPVLPECKSHEGKLCEMFCNDCHEPSCVLCVTSEHKKHDITNIEGILEKCKQKIISDLNELENTIRPKYASVDAEAPFMDFDKVLSAIQEQEDNICRDVREIGSHMKDEIVKQKREFEQKTKEVRSSAAQAGKEVNEIIQNSKDVLHSNTASDILRYQSKNDNYRSGPKQMQPTYSIFSPGQIRQEQLKEMFGTIQNQSSFTKGKQVNLLKMMAKPVVISTIQSPYGAKKALWRVLCNDAETIWTCGNDREMYEIDHTGSILKSIQATKNVFAMSLNMDKELIVSEVWPDNKVYKYDGHGLTVVINLLHWSPRGLCHSRNGDLLVSMRTMDETQSMVVRYAGGIETKVIHRDVNGSPLFSVKNNHALLLSENGNEDICVADYAGEAVVVVNPEGEMRFQYRGNNSAQSKHQRSFKPLQIANDVHQQILIQDFMNNVVHVIDSTGHFVLYLEYPCNGGLSVDLEHNLVVGDHDTGEIRMVRYMQRDL